MMNPGGRFFQLPPGAIRRGPAGLGELPSTPLSENGTLAVNPPFGRPPNGNLSAPTQTPGQARILGDNQSVWQYLTFNVDAAPIKLQDQTFRKFFLIQNNSAAGTLFIGFGWQPNAGNGLTLPAGVGYEPFSYPVNEIWIASDGPVVSGLMLYGV